jgi:hypothetical protein
MTGPEDEASPPDEHAFGEDDLDRCKRHISENESTKNPKKISLHVNS